MPPSKVHILREVYISPKLSVPMHLNMHVIPNFAVRIAQGMCFRKMVMGPRFENERIGAKNPSEITLSTPAGTPETRFNATF